MSDEAKFCLGMFFMYVVFGALYMGHEIGVVNGARDERIANQQRLESCQKLVVSNMYAKDEK